MAESEMAPLKAADEAATSDAPPAELGHNVASRPDAPHAAEYTHARQLELAGFMKHLNEGIALTRHLESGRTGKICLRGGEDGVEWDTGCCASGRKGFEWTELKEVRTYSKESCHPTPTLAKSPMPTKNEICLTFSLILTDEWSLDVTCHSAPGHHLAVRGFELARKHHMQEGHKIGVKTSDADLSHMQRATKGLHNAHLLYAEHRHASHGGGSRIIDGATVEVAYAHSIEPAHAVFDPCKTDGGGRPVRDFPFRVKIPRGYMRFPTRAWHEGQYVIGVVKKFDRKTELYTIEYKSGPYKQTEGPRLNLGPPVKNLPDATIIECCHREHLCVEETIDKSDNFPFLMVLISIAQVACFGYWAPRVLEDGEKITATTPVAGPDYLWFKTVRNFPYCNDRRSFWTMMLSYQLVHAGLEHIGFNIVLQLLFGVPIELVHGAIVFFIYEAGVVCGALACALSDPYIAVVGCSGGVYCLFGIHVAHMILNWSDMKHSAIPRFMRVLIFGMLFSSEVITWWCLNTAGKSFAAHAGGALCGLLMGVGFMTNFEIECWEVVLRWICRVALALFVVTGIVWYIVEDPPAPLFMWTYHDSNKMPCCFQLFECDIERKFKYYDHFSCNRVLEDDKNSYQYRLKAPGSGRNDFQTCNAIRQELDGEFGCGDCGPYK